MMQVMYVYVSECMVGSLFLESHGCVQIDLMIGEAGIEAVPLIGAYPAL